MERQSRLGRKAREACRRVDVLIGVCRFRYRSEAICILYA